MRHEVQDTSYKHGNMAIQHAKRSTIMGLQVCMEHTPREYPTRFEIKLFLRGV